MAPKSAAGLFAYQAAYVLSGSATVLIYQWQNGIVVDEKSGRTFSHPIGQTIIVYLVMIGLWIGRRVYLANRSPRGGGGHDRVVAEDVDGGTAAVASATTTTSIPSVDGDGGADADANAVMPPSSTGMPLPSFRWYYAAGPGFFHFSSLFMTVLAVKYTSAAVVQILRGSVVIFSAGLTRVLLKRTLAPFQYFGIGIVVTGVILVSVATLQRVKSKGNEEPFGSNPLLGDTLIISAQFFLALRGVLEERVMKKHNVHELEMAGWEGFVAATACLLTALIGIIWPSAQIDDLGEFVTDMGASWWALISTLLLVALQPVLQSTALAIVKITSAVTRTVLSQLRAVCVWVPSVLFMHGIVSPLEITGFVVLTFGAIVYKDMGPQLPSFCYPAPPPPEGNDGDSGGDDERQEEMLPKSHGGDDEPKRYGATAV